MNCINCGSELKDGEKFCTFCGTAQVEEKPVKPENFGMGFLGALIGALIGGASIVLIAQMGYVAAISGLILAFCTLKGYELLGHQLSKRGIVVSLILIVITPFLADIISWGFVIMEAFADIQVTFVESLAFLPVLLADDSELMTQYVTNLLTLYGFMALGAFIIIRNTLRGK